MKVRRLYLIALVALLVALEACAPRAAPTPAQGPLAPQEAPATPSPATPDTSPENASWAKVVSEAKKEGKVTAYSFNWVGDSGLVVASAFQRSYGITLEIITGRGAEFTEKLKTERRLGMVVGDMTEGSSALVNGMKLGGLLTSVATELPILREKDVWWVHPTVLDPVDRAYLAWQQNTYSLWINTNLVKPGEEPTSWKHLLEPKWNGKMSILEPRLNASFLGVMAALLDKQVWDTDYIKALYRQDLRFAVSTVEQFRSLAKGETHLVILGTDATGSTIVAEGAPIRQISAKEGIVVGVVVAAAIANGPHPNATKVLLNWLLSLEGQTTVGRAKSIRVVRKDVPDFRPLAAQTEASIIIPLTPEYNEQGTRFFQEKWFDKVVGR